MKGICMNYLIPFGMELAVFLMLTVYNSILAGIAGVIGGFIGMFVFRELAR